MPIHFREISKLHEKSFPEFTEFKNWMKLLMIRIQTNNLSKLTGMSLGGSLSSTERSKEEFVLVVNPIMGDTSLSYTIGLGDELEASTKYLFNRFSLESDLSLGVLFKSIQARLDSRGLLKLKWELPLQNLKFVFGIEF